MSMTPEEARLRQNERERLRWHATKTEREAKWEKTKSEREQAAGRFNLEYNYFPYQDGSSYQAWRKSVGMSKRTFNNIANLKPDPGQTLAELIHELSGYSMDVCELIANPPILEDIPEPPTVIEDSPTLTPPPAPDLF